MIEQSKARAIIQERLDEILAYLNEYLRGINVNEIKSILSRVGRNGELPHWYDLLSNGNSMPNLDGKTIGSVIEMTFLGVLEKKIFLKNELPPLEINPAKGVDIPTINLGIKSPSENYCTSEPFFSPYERILGNTHDSVILLTDYQTAKKKPPPVRIQILKIVYLKGSQIADKNLCKIALQNRNELLKVGDVQCKKLFQFLCYLNQQDWLGKALLELLPFLFSNSSIQDKVLDKILLKFQKKRKKDIKNGEFHLDESIYDKLNSIKVSSNRVEKIINYCSDWVIHTHKDFARMPNDNEWERFLMSPLDGKIGLSFALQWRFNFGHVFR